jgi:HSP20 family protein
MNLVRFNRGGDLLGMSREMDRLLSTCTPAAGTRAWAPAADVRESDDGFAIRLDMPGFDRDKVKVTVFGDTVTVSGERAGLTEEKQGGWHRQERFHGTFERRFNFETQLDSSHVKAIYRDGVLDITVPKAESAKPKEITVDLDS